MTTRNWKRVQPNNLVHALRLCKDFAIERKRLSVERIADLLAVKDDTLYHWIANGRMPALVIPAYEHICGCNFVSRWLAASSGQLVIEMPKGKPAKATDLVNLSGEFGKALQMLAAFYDEHQGESRAALREELQEALRKHIEEVAYHEQNVASYANPELEFEA